MSYELILQKAIELHQNGALNEAERLYRQILATAPENADVWNLLGLVAQQRGLHEQAVECFERASKFAPQHFPIYFNAAVSYGALGQIEEAISAYQKVLALKPDVAEAATGLGNIYWQQGNIAKATEAYQKALDMVPEYLPAAVNLAEISDDTATLEKLARRPDFEALYYLGRRALKAENYAEAIVYLQRADELKPAVEIKFLLAQSLEKNNDLTAALPKYYQALNLAPQNDEIMTHIADLEARNGAMAEAEKYYKNAIKANPQNLAAHMNLANLLCAKNRTLEALEEYRQALILAPNKPEICYNLALVVKSVGDYEQALALMFQAFYGASEHDDWALNIVETLTLWAAVEPQKAQTVAANWLKQMPQYIPARHINAVLQGQKSPCESEYNKILFDNFAADYEQTLHKIGYCVVDEIVTKCAPLSGKVLDLGCGSGLVGAKLKTDHNCFMGVDLSANMLELAQNKGVYDELHQADIIDYLQNNQQHLPSTIVAADVFCYMGDLAPIFRLCVPQRLIFSVEKADDVADFKMQISGRYRHNPQWIEEKLHQAGYGKIERYDFSLRQENGQNVAGCLFDAK